MKENMVKDEDFATFYLRYLKTQILFQENRRYNFSLLKIYAHLKKRHYNCKIVIIICMCDACDEIRVSVNLKIAENT